MSGPFCDVLKRLRAAILPSAVAGLGLQRGRVWVGVDDLYEFLQDYDRIDAAYRLTQAELEEILLTLPGTTYMDPPDGGSVIVAEQFRRMAADAAAFRGSQPKPPPPEYGVTFGQTYRLDYPWRPSHSWDRCPGCFECSDPEYRCGHCGHGMPPKEPKP